MVFSENPNMSTINWVPADPNVLNGQWVSAEHIHLIDEKTWD
jgi:hypothetical protein